MRSYFLKKYYDLNRLLKKKHSKGFVNAFEMCNRCAGAANCIICCAFHFFRTEILGHV